MPKDTRTKTGAGGKKMNFSPWRGLPAKLRGIPGSQELFTMWGNDSFRRAPPALPPNLSVWDARDPSRPLPYSFQTPTPIVPPPITGVAFVTQARAARSKPKAKPKLPRLLPAFHPSSRSLSDNPSSSTISPSVPEQSYLYTYPVPSSSSQQPGSFAPLSWPPPPHPPGYVKDEPMVIELPSPSYASSSEQGHGSEQDDSSSVRSECLAPKKKKSFVYLPIPALPCSPPLSPWSSPGQTCPPLMPEESLSGEDLPQDPPSIGRAYSEPVQSRDGEGWGVYEVCRRRRLPRMIFKKPVTPLPELDLSGAGTDLVLPALRSPCTAPDDQDSADEARDFDASCQAERRARYSPYQTVNASRGAQEEGEGDLPPLRLLLDQLEIDEHRRAQSEAQSQPPSDALLADKLLINLVPADQRASLPSSRHGRRAAKTTEAATPVPTQPSLSAVAGLAPRHPGQVKLGAVFGSGAAIPCTAGGRTAASVHPQRGGLHAF